MKVIISSSMEKLNDLSAGIIASLIRKKNNAKIGLATGTTPVGIYRSLVSLFTSGEVEFSNVFTYNLDEYLGLSKNHPSSFFSFMKQHFFNQVNINKDKIFIPNGETEFPENECERYNRLLEDAGPLDIQILGVGLNGHIGFNEPGPTLSPHTHIVQLTEETRTVNSPAFSSFDDVPTHAITMGVADILLSKMFLFMALGEEKALIMKQALEGPITTECPASLLQLHPNCTIFLDKKAASTIDKNNKIYNIQYI